MESLLASLAVPETTTAASYVSYLTSLSLSQVQAQSSTLRLETQSINSSLTALALRESQAFSAASASTLDALPDVSSTVHVLEELVPSIDAASAHNPEKLQNIARRRKEAALLGRNESRLQEIFDIPGLVRTCVTKGHYTEATELTLHLSRIHARHPGSRILQSLVDETQESMQRMTLQLLVLLNSPLKLAMAIKVVGLLRRSRSFEEDELRYLFLKGRYDALQGSWAALEETKSTPDRYIKKFVEIFREQAFAIITQYTSIFPTSIGQEQDDGKLSEIGAFEHNLLPSFTQQVIDDLRVVLREFLPKVESQSAKNTLLTQVLYTSQSLARAGCEFIGLVVELFGEDRVWPEIVMNQRQMARRLE